MSTYNRRTTAYYNRRRKRREPKVFKRGMRITLFTFFVLFILAFAGLLTKIYFINRNDGDRYKKAAMSQQSYTNTVLNYQRGAIKDRNNTTLAVSVRKYNLVLEPRTLLTDELEREVTLTAISQHFAIDRQILETKVSEKPNSMYEHLDELKELDEDVVEAFKVKMKEEKDITGVWFEETYTRNYPLNTVASNIVGFLSADDQGTIGVEASYNDILCGTTGREYGYFDSNMNLQRTIKEAKNGDSVVLTIDANVQQIIEQEIADFQANGMGAERVAVMMMNPKNGEILAMASNSTFDLNNPRDLSTLYTEEQLAAMTDQEKSNVLSGIWANYCVASTYEPGSTFKPFTIAASFDENLIKASSTFVCEGAKNVAGSTIRCNNHSGHGVVNVEYSLMQSCNCALMDMGEMLGREKFDMYNKLFGFGQKTGVDLPDESSGQVHRIDNLNPVEIATSSFGQTQTVTMVQMLGGFCSLINGGSYYQPHIVKEIQNSKGDVVETIEPVIVKKTTTEDTSAKLRKYLKSTVEHQDGTAGPAKVEGYSIGGKTGTAQKHTEQGLIDEGNYLVSFIGCVPAENPEVAYYVIMDEPHAKEQAHSSYATEFSAKLMKKVLPFLGQYAAIENNSEETE